MMALRAVTQKPLDFFMKSSGDGKFDQHNVQNGVFIADSSDKVADDGGEKIFYSDDYMNLFNLVTHSERRAMLDVVTKHIFASILIRCLDAVEYFDLENKREDKDKERKADEKQKCHSSSQPSKEQIVVGKHFCAISIIVT